MQGPHRGSRSVGEHIWLEHIWLEANSEDSYEGSRNDAGIQQRPYKTILPVKEGSGVGKSSWDAKSQKDTTKNIKFTWSWA